jgi:hypothetical protein
VVGLAIGLDPPAIERQQGACARLPPNDRVRERLAPADRMPNQGIRVKDELVGVCEPVTPTNGMSPLERLEQRLALELGRHGREVVAVTR